MKRLLLMLALVAESAFAGGTAYYTTSRVTIAGLYDWGTLPPGTLYPGPYRISASNSPLAGVSISGDPQFTIDGSACPGVQSCSAVVSFTADVGGDYFATIVGTSANAVRVRGSSTAHPIKAHVVGADYALVGVDDGDATATFTLSSTGETDLIDPTFAASTWNNVGTATITANTCDAVVPSGTSCTVSVALAFNADETPSVYGYVLLQAYGNTRQQPPARVTLVLPPPAE
jgi:hypothetical protein